MRFVIASLVTFSFLGTIASPAYAGGRNTDACKSSCDTNYQFCVSRAITKAAKKSCKNSRKTCKSQCR